MAIIYEIYGTDAHSMTFSLMQAAQVSKMIPPCASIALKPNLVLSGTPDTGATTHSGVLSGCIEYLQKEGFTRISVIESSWVGGNTERAMKACGYDKVCAKYGVPFYDLKKDQTRTVQTALRPMEITCRALDADFLIDLPVLKGHCQTAMTCALKNLKGCLPDREKRRFHSDGLIEPIAALGAVLRPALVIVDSICGDLNFEEGGNPIQTNRMLLGTDPVQIDAYGCRLMGLRLEDVPYIQLAETWGAGSTRIQADDVIIMNEPTDGAEYPAASGQVKRLTRGVQAESACSACYAALVRALYLAQQEGLRVPDRIVIGQKWRGKHISELGIGNCCSGGADYVKGCPPTPDAILARFRERT